MKKEFKIFQNQKSREFSLPAVWSPWRQQEKLHPHNMLNLTLVLDPSPIFQEITAQLTAGFSAVYFSQFSPSLHDMFWNTYAAFLSNPMSVFVALQFIGMRSLESNFTSMIIQSTIFKWSLEEGL